MKHVEIGGYRLGPDTPPFIVVETGTTCNGDLDTALAIIDAAADAGADAIKFMIIGPEFFMSDRTVTYEYEWAGGKGSENMFEMFEGLKFGRDEWHAIKARCDQRGLRFYATVDYVQGVDLAEELGVVAYKLASWDAGNIPLIRAMARTGKPIVVDLGPATLIEIQKLIDVCAAEGNEQIVLLHCSHSKTDDGINLLSVPYLEQVFDFPAGYSADSRDVVPDLVSVGLGAKILEKRVTLDKDHEGHHHVKALEPDEFAAWVETIRRAQSMLGERAVKPSEEDLRQRELYFVSIVADEDIPVGATITEEMLACKRPGHGISPELMEVLVGRVAQRDIRRNELLTWDAV